MMGHIKVMLEINQTGCCIRALSTLQSVCVITANAGWPIRH